MTGRTFPPLSPTGCGARPFSRVEICDWFEQGRTFVFPNVNTHAASRRPAAPYVIGHEGSVATLYACGACKGTDSRFVKPRINGHASCAPNLDGCRPGMRLAWPATLGSLLHRPDQIEAALKR